MARGAAYQEAQRRIKEAGREGATELNLLGLDLTALPPEIGQLTGLQILDLRNNQLGALPPEIGKLPRLWSLDLSDNQLTALPPEIVQLTSLQSLDLRNNQLTALPPEIVQLTGLSGLYLDANPLQPDLAAAYSQGTGVLLQYLRECARDGVALHEAKLILVGEGEVGKSSLLGALRGDPWVEGRPTTHGVEIKPVRLTDGQTGAEVTLNAWDFGGQRVYRPTHQLFFSAPAIYLVVWKPRQGPELGQVRYWTRLIKRRAYDEARPHERPRLLIVATHGGPQERQAHIDRHALLEEFPDLIAGFYHIDNKPDENGECAGLDALKQAIARAVVSIYPRGRQVAASWARLGDALRERSERTPYLTYAQYEALCERVQVGPELAEAYARMRNELGHLIHDHDDEGLRDVVILRPEWLSKAISFVLDDRRAKEQGGLIAHSRFAHLWNDPDKPPEERYPVGLHPVFLRLMERYDLTYRVSFPNARASGNDTETSLVAQLVPGDRPSGLDVAWPPEPAGNGEQSVQVCRIVDAKTGDAARAEGLIYALIVRLHRYSLGREDHRRSLHWQGGLLLDDDYNGRALLEQAGDDVRITVRAAYPQYFMGALLGEVQWLVESFWRGLDCRIAVPCCTPGCQRLHDQRALIVRKSHGIHRDVCPICETLFEIDDLLAGPPQEPVRVAELAWLKQDIAELKQGQEAGFRALSVGQQRLLSRVNEQFDRMMAALDAPSRDGPRLFSLTLADRRRWERPGWVTQKVRLTLWCEHVRLPLPQLWGDPDRGSYVFEWPREWMIKIAPVARLLAGALSIALPVAGAGVKLGLDQATYERIEDGLGLAQASFSALLDAGGEAGKWMTAGREDLPGGRDLRGGERSDRSPAFQTERLPADVDLVREHGELYAAHDGALRELHALLKERDPGLGGLRRVRNNRREYLWVHPDYAKFYDPGLPGGFEGED